MSERKGEKMKLCAGQCRYLIALYHLSSINHIVRSVDIANTLSVTRPSVSRMLKCMARLEFIEPDYSASVRFTEKGRETAERLAKDFNDINAFFTEILKLDKDSAYNQSIQFLASFPEHTVERLSAVTRNTLEKRKRKKGENH